jgi:hypothetical protein
MPKIIRIFVMATLCLLVTTPLKAQEALPAAVQTYAKQPLAKVGSGTYRKFGFSVYRATLWAPGGVWNPDQPSALQLRYMRGLSQSTLADALTDDIEGQGVADDATFTRWSNWINQTMPAVQDGDVMVGVRKPGGDTVIFFNGQEIGRIHEEALSQAFFNIWLGKDADEDLRASLLKQ